MLLCMNKFDFAMPRLKKNRRKAGGVSCFRFRNEYHKVEIALRVVQFWSEIQQFVVTRLI